MNKQNLMNFGKFRFLPAACALALSAWCLSGCSGEQEKEKAKSTRQPGTAGKAAPAITLPMLNALFFEKDFEQELRTKLELSSKQVEQLKQAASASVSDLDEGDTSYLGSTKAAIQLSKARIIEIIGADKAGQLFQLAADRYAGGDVAGLWPTEPNTVPEDTRIVVNAPAFRMDVFEKGKLLKTYRIGIGYPEFPLPVGMRRAEEIIFNPTWTPPDEPWVKGKVEAGKKVAAGSKLNPLGPVKIPIGLPSLIHGGKAPAKLGTFASHGCVGLTDRQVQEFTGLLSKIGEVPISQDSIEGFGKNKTKTKTVKLAKAIPVELRYETIVAENGNLFIYRDIYEQGSNTPENVSKVLAVYGLKYESLSSEEKAAIEQALAEMNRDAKGNTVAADSGQPAAGNSAKKSSGGKVTRSVTGQKEIVIAIAGLKGKGYPAAAALNTGAETNGASMP